MRAAREAGGRIPGDLSVAGFDDVPVAAFLAPALTMVRLDFGGLGRTCFGLLHRLRDLAAPAPGPCGEPTLIVRESTGPHRGTSGSTAGEEPAAVHTPGATCRSVSPSSCGLGRYSWGSLAPEVLTPLVARLSSMLVRESDYCSIYRISVGRAGLCRPHRPPLKAVPGDVFMRHRAAVQRDTGGVAVAVPQPTQGVSSCIRIRWATAPQVFCFSPKGCLRPCAAGPPPRPQREGATLHVLAPSRVQSPQGTGNGHGAGGRSPARLRCGPRHRLAARLRRGHAHGRCRPVHESGDLAGFRGHRHHPRR
ncbi:substrate-binding domain-containing protein [Streptomyces javensis]|uniref:substrate-binding domain-containing protein n=1 Tax=Streptomyces javensis TaxID=114698 RepID=UPI0031F8876C